MFPFFRRGSRPRPSGRSVGRSASLVLLACTLAAVAVACAGSATASFNPTSPCTTDGKAPGAYPDLEALLPRTFNGKPPQTLDSGRNCTAQNLGTLATHGLKEVRFAGGVWPEGQAGVTMAVFRASGLQSEWLAEWYEATARAARVTGDIQLSKPTIAGRPGQRMDLVNGEAPQTVITWPSTTAGTVNVVITSDEPEDRIQAALAAFP
jgi:hypothetical protein